jgi:putative transposase
MTDILALLQCLDPIIALTTLRQMDRIITAILTTTGRVTMVNIARWAGKGGSYRTVQRFFHTAIPWALAFWLFFRQHLLNPDEVYLLAGDETVVTKSGKQTHGLDRFFSSVYGRAVPGLSFFALSLISVQERRSYPVMVEQIVRTEEEKAAAKAKKKGRKAGPKPKRKPGRLRGSKNKDKTQVTFTPELLLIKTMIQKLLLLVGGSLPLTYLLLDGKFGHNNALQMTLQCGLHLVSKLRHDAALHFLYDGPYSGHGPYRKYGDKIDYDHLPAEYLQQRTVDDGIETCIYQMTMLHKDFAQPLNVVTVVKTNLKTQSRAQVVLFSSDLDLAFDQLIDYYALRFQIEFNFRDAKQFWGLEDFMNVKEIAVTNAASLSLFMVNLTHLLLRQFRQLNPQAGVLDLKAHFHGHKYVSETLKLFPETPDPILLSQVFGAVAQLGCVHPVEPCLSPP